MTEEQIEYAECLRMPQEIMEMILSGIFDREQIDVILLGYFQKIPAESIKIFANPLFDYRKMDLIRQALFSGIDFVTVMLFARLELSYVQMREIYYCLVYGISSEKILDIAKSYLSGKEMAKLRCEYLINEENEIKTLVKPTQVEINAKIKTEKVRRQNEIASNDFIGFDYNQITVIKKALKAKILPSQLEILKNKEFDAAQMETILWGFCENRLSENKVALYAKECYCAEQMHEIRKAIVDNVELSHIYAYFTPDFEARQMSYIRLALKKQFTAEQMKYIANPKITGMEINDIIMGFTNGFSPEDLGLSNYKESKP